MNQTPSETAGSDSPTGPLDKVPRRNPILVLSVVAGMIAIIALILAMLFQSPSFYD